MLIISLRTYALNFDRKYIREINPITNFIRLEHNGYSGAWYNWNDFALLGMVYQDYWILLELYIDTKTQLSAADLLLKSDDKRLKYQNSRSFRKGLKVGIFIMVFVDIAIFSSFIIVKTVKKRKSE